MKVTVNMRTYAHYMTDVELSDDELELLASNLETTIEALTADDIRELAEDKAFTKGVPSLCHQEEISLGDWETEDKTEDVIEIYER